MIKDLGFLGPESVAESSGLRLSYQPSSGVMLEATEGRTTTIIGSYRRDMKNILTELGNEKSTDFGPRVGGFNVLNVPDDLISGSKQFRTVFNEPWIVNAIGRNDIFLMATEPVFGPASPLFRLNMQSGKMELSAFGQEYLLMRQTGFIYASELKQMIRKP